MSDQEIDKQKYDHAVRVATFNVSMEASNYQAEDDVIYANTILIDALKKGDSQQIKNIAEIIQSVRPDIILLNEFDYIEDPSDGITIFQRKYLQVSQNGQPPIDYPFFYHAPVNTGVEIPGHNSDSRLTHYGFGRYAGQYGMVLLSKYPIETEKVRTFQTFLWQDMPGNLMPKGADGEGWYSESEAKVMRLSSKSHWDVPISICETQLNILASHPTPPVFDGDEDRNGRRNHDEIRFWRDYIEGRQDSYHYDDNGEVGGIKSPQSFVILGDLNASPVEGDSYPGAIEQLILHDTINDSIVPGSEGGKLNQPSNPYAINHTAEWGMRVDYVLPSADLKVSANGVFWPAKHEQNKHLVEDRKASSDHRLVWVDLKVSHYSEHCQ
ncbi:endonuclease/exonuclease/phosphatase family protein [Aliikangiella marina]|uniref:Endonuclease/exonuclease/phosphatase family protein n=2 Tax=Aliikangiella marina TaxID=1712262 RepID=A0A545T7K0_9GAMM|nr:endonuclease/exonuclease/phosphatase family protein [Aliikangiella marina]